jgi:hypothetical protein
MVEILSRCGFRSDLCLAYRPNIEKNPANRQVLSDGWFKYFGFRIEPENIICNGCLDDQCITLDLECPIRPCVIAKGLENCAIFEQYGCDKLKERLVTFEGIQAHFNEPIPEEDRNRFIRPYENKDCLETIRQQPGKK